MKNFLGRKIHSPPLSRYDLSGQTPLHLAARVKLTSLYSDFLKRGADLNARVLFFFSFLFSFFLRLIYFFSFFFFQDKTGSTPLFIVVHNLGTLSFVPLNTSTFFSSIFIFSPFKSRKRQPRRYQRLPYPQSPHFTNPRGNFSLLLFSFLLLYII